MWTMVDQGRKEEGGEGRKGQTGPPRQRLLVRVDVPERHFPSAPTGRGGRRWPCWVRGDR